VEQLERLLSPDEVAQFVGLSRLSVYRAIRAGRLLHLRVGRRLRIRQQDVETWLGLDRQAPPLPAQSASRRRRGNER
jgi:excisionase family DNA binding protein